MPYLAYDEVDFDVIVGTYGDCFDRYAIRLAEVRESIKIVRQILDKMPSRRLPRAGQEGHATAAGPHRRVDGSAHPPLQDLHRGLQGARGRGLRRHRGAPRARRAATWCPTASAKPFRCHIRGPSFVNLQCLAHMMHNSLVADAVAVISSVDPVLGDVDR